LAHAPRRSLVSEMSATRRIYNRLFTVFAISLLPMFVACAIVPGETRIARHRQSGSRHHFYTIPRTPDLDGSRVAGIPKLNPKWWIENSDDPLPWWWKPDAPLDERKRSWMRRNPFHNFTHYVVGVSDRHTHRIGLNARSIWNDKGPFNASVTRAGPLIYLPMISNRGRFLEWYVGWRESGSFGAAMRLAQHDSDGTGPRGRSPLSRALAAREQAENMPRSQPHPPPAQPITHQDLMPLPPVSPSEPPARGQYRASPHSFSTSGPQF